MSKIRQVGSGFCNSAPITGFGSRGTINSIYIDLTVPVADYNNCWVINDVHLGWRGYRPVGTGYQNIQKRYGRPAANKICTYLNNGEDIVFRTLARFINNNTLRISCPISRIRNVMDDDINYRFLGRWQFVEFL